MSGDKNMLRFIDIRNQGTGNRFAFYDTIRDRFVEISSEMAWKSLKDFKYCCEVAAEKELFERCKVLCSEWVNDEKEDDQENFWELSSDGSTKRIELRQKLELKKHMSGSDEMIIEIEEIPILDGGGYRAKFSEYPALLGDGETVEDALQELKTFTAYMYEQTKVKYVKIKEWDAWFKDNE